MAFLDFSQPMAGPAPVASIAQGVSTPTDFTQQEWQIVALARTDGLRSLQGPGRFVRLGRWIFGEDTNLTLASERLEALRRLAVEAWHRGYAIDSHDIHAFMAAGFSLAQYELVLASISRGRNALNQRG